MRGSLINRLNERHKVTTVPNVGDGVTEYLYSDRHAYTVQKVRVSPSGKTIEIWCSRDQVRRVDDNGMGDNQTYEYTTVDDGPRAHYKSVSGKPFRRVYAVMDDKAPDGVSLRMSDTIARVGIRDEHYDYSF